MKQRVLILVFLLAILVGLPLFISGCGSVGGISAAGLSFISGGGGGGAAPTSGWTRIAIGAFGNKNLKFISFHLGNDLVGSIVGFETIAGTTDGGATWTMVTPDTTSLAISSSRNTLTNKTFNHYSEGGGTSWAVGDNGMVYWINPNTSKWERWKLNANANGYDDFAHANDGINWRFMSWQGSSGVIVGNYPNGGAMLVYSTSDGGMNWTEITPSGGTIQANTQLYGCKLVEGTNIRYAGANGVDTAATLGVFIAGSSVNNSVTHPIYSYRVPSSGDDWFSAKDGFLFKYISAQSTLVERATGAAGNALFGVDIYTQSGWAVGDGGQIVTSKDSGESWNTAQSSTVTTRLNSVVIAKKVAQVSPPKNIYTVYACGNNGVILKNAETRETTE